MVAHMTMRMRMNIQTDLLTEIGLMSPDFHMTMRMNIQTDLLTEIGLMSPDFPG